MIVLDPGHGGHQPAGRSTPLGAQGPGGVQEKDITLLLCRQIASLLHGTWLTRRHDENRTLRARTSAAPEAGVFVSVHAGPHPSSVWVHSNSSASSAALATRLADVLNTTVEHGPMAVLSPSHHPTDRAACLVELGVLGSAEATQQFIRSGHRQLAHRIADALFAHTQAEKFRWGRASGERVLAACEGRFGRIEVREDHLDRWLCVNGKNQGGVFCMPSADTVAEAMPGPGPVISCAYPLGWMVGALAAPAGEALMLGLGSGAGPIALLANFPDMSVTVIEVDPVLIETTKKWFPLVRHYLSTGRLRLEVGDANEVVPRLQQSYDLAFVDVYTGSYELAVLDDDTWRTLGEKAADTWINWIGPLGGDGEAKLHQRLTTLGTALVTAVDVQTGLPRNTPRNRLLGTALPRSGLLEGFVPYAELPMTGSVRRWLQRSWKDLSRQLSHRAV